MWAPDPTRVCCRIVARALTLSDDHRLVFLKEPRRGSRPEPRHAARSVAALGVTAAQTWPSSAASGLVGAGSHWWGRASPDQARPQMERLPPDEVALVRSAAEALAARGGKGRTTAKQELALAAALAILAGRWRYHPEKEHVALACKAYGAGMKQVRDYLKHLQLLHGPAAAGGGAWRPYEDCLQQLDRFMAWRASQGHPERGEPFHQLPNAPLRHAHSSRDALRSVSRRCPGQLVLVRRHCQRGRRWANSDADCDEEDELSEPVIWGPLLERVVSSQHDPSR